MSGCVGQSWDELKTRNPWKNGLYLTTTTEENRRDTYLSRKTLRHCWHTSFLTEKKIAWCAESDHGFFHH